MVLVERMGVSVKTVNRSWAELVPRGYGVHLEAAVSSGRRGLLEAAVSSRRR